MFIVEGDLMTGFVYTGYASMVQIEAACQKSNRLASMLRILDTYQR